MLVLPYTVVPKVESWIVAPPTHPLTGLNPANLYEDSIVFICFVLGGMQYDVFSSKVKSAGHVMQLFMPSFEQVRQLVSHFAQYCTVPKSRFT